MSPDRAWELDRERFHDVSKQKDSNENKCVSEMDCAGERRAVLPS